MQEFLQALAIIADECSMELIDAAVQLGADPAYLQGTHPERKPEPATCNMPSPESAKLKKDHMLLTSTCSPTCGAVFNFKML